LLAGFLRVDVAQSTTLGEIRTAAAHLARKEGLRRQNKLKKSSALQEMAQQQQINQTLPAWAMCGLASTVEVELSTVAGPDSEGAGTGAVATLLPDGLTVMESSLFAKRRLTRALATRCV
jgi:hypothetical protein